MPFTLKSNATEYQFDTDGSVSSAGAAAGTWTVTKENRISLKLAAGNNIEFDVNWSFIDNQLWLVVGGQKTFNFHATGFPDYQVVNNRIQVSPRVPASPFTFTLSCGFTLNDNIDLVVKIGATESILSGALEDTRGQFIYRFKDPAMGQQDALIFSGKWERDNQVEGEIRLNFVYVVGGETRTIAIPKAFDVNPFTNSLRLRYEKNGTSRLLELAGEIRFANNSTLVFTVRKSGANGTSQIAVDFRLSGSGKTIKSVEITVLKSNGADGSRTLEIGGQLSAQVGKVGLTINFRYAKTSGGAATASVSLAVDGKFALKNGTIEFLYTQTVSGKTISIVARDIQFGAATFGGGISVTQIGAQRTIRAFAGLQW